MVVSRVTLDNRSCSEFLFASCVAALSKPTATKSSLRTSYIQQQTNIKKVVMAAIGMGLALLKYPKFGLGGLGGLAGAICGKFLHDLLLQFVTITDQGTDQMLLVSCVFICALLAAWLMVACFKNAYCLVIPFVGAICVSDSFCTFFLFLRSFLSSWC